MLKRATSFLQELPGLDHEPTQKIGRRPILAFLSLNAIQPKEARMEGIFTASTFEITKEMEGKNTQKVLYYILSPI